MNVDTSRSLSLSITRCDTTIKSKFQGNYSQLVVNPFTSDRSMDHLDGLAGVAGFELSEFDVEGNVPGEKRHLQLTECAKYSIDTKFSMKHRQKHRFLFSV